MIIKTDENEKMLTKLQSDLDDWKKKKGLIESTEMIKPRKIKKSKKTGCFDLIIIKKCSKRK